MSDRVPLIKGTIIRFENLSCYRISGAPIGFGGGSIIYPAEKVSLQNGRYESDGLRYAIKECYPKALGHRFIRAYNGQIMPENRNKQAEEFLSCAQKMQLDEGETSRRLYLTASRILPSTDSTPTAKLYFPDNSSASVHNTFTVMEDLSSKGQAIRECIEEKNFFSAVETFRIIQQLLFALKEVHDNDFLHLDIQDGNTFLRGTLDNKSELVTLIDFGSSRKMERGLTAPIQDRMIYASEGFAAPEIMLNNDGNLRLGPETDIFSVGALAYYLLCGRRISLEQVVANNSGIYIKGNQLRRLKCPKHVEPMLQHVLARALAKERSERYQSVDEMLEAVEKTISALEPFRSDMSTAYFDAFISYKHNNIDSKAALELQKALEKYRAPKGVSEDRKPFKRVFVDEGEFSSCADFGQQLNYALRNSEWMIVVCSEDTPKSPWVQLEIETFLKYHDRSRILAVLTGGNPETSFPPQLKGLQDGFGEVLAANAQGNSAAEICRRIRGDALLKLAAPMLGLSFGEIKNRQKIYFLQKMAALFACLVVIGTAFGVYAMNRAVLIKEQKLQIEEEYERALVNESRFLAEQAVRRIDEKDPVSAVELALQALPSEKQDRPVLAEAKYALGKALDVYRSPENAEGTARITGVLEGDYTDFFTDEEGKVLFLWDKYEYGFQVWDVQTLNLIGHYFEDDAIYMMSDEFVCEEDNTIIVQTTNLVRKINYLSGEIVWQCDVYDIIACCTSEDMTRFAVLSGDSLYYPAGGYDGDCYELCVDIIDTRDGSILNHVPFAIEGLDYLFLTDQLAFSPDKRSLFFAGRDQGDVETDSMDNSVVRPFVLEIESGVCRLLYDSDSNLMSLTCFEDSIVCMRNISSGYNFHYKSNNSIHEYEAPYAVLLECYDPDSLGLRWSHELTSYFFENSRPFIEECSYKTATQSGQGLLFIYADKCVLLERSSGQKITSYEMPASVLDYKPADNGFEVVTENGKIVKAKYDLNYTMAVPYFNEHLSRVCRSGDMVFTRSDSVFYQDSVIRCYRLNASDENYSPMFELEETIWELIDCNMTEGSLQAALVRDNILAFYDEAENKLYENTIPEQSMFYISEVLGIDWEKRRLLLKDWPEDNDNWLGWDFSFVQLDSGRVSPVECPPSPADEHVFVADTLFLDGKVILVAECRDGDKLRISLLEWIPGETGLKEYDSFELPENEYLEWLHVCFDEQSGMLAVVVITDDNTGVDSISEILLYDVYRNESSSINLRQELTEDPYTMSFPFAWDEESGIALCVEKTVYIIDSTGKVKQNFEFKEEQMSLRYVKDGEQLLTVSQSGIISCIDPEGTDVYTLDLSPYIQDRIDAMHMSDYFWQTVGEKTELMFYNGGTNAFLLDLSQDNVAVEAVLENCICYDDSGNSFVMGNTYNCKSFGRFMRYSTEKLVEMGNSFLNK